MLLHRCKMGALSLVILAAAASVVFAQDTLRIGLSDFIRQGVTNAGQLDYEKQSIALAENRVNQAQAQRYLPKFELSTQHGLIPGVYSDSAGLSRNEYYLDPNLENDWEDWAIFTRAQIDAIQPIMSWGAIDNAINAAKAGARAAEEEFRREQQAIELRLYELYYSYVLAIEINRILDEAQRQVNRVDEQITKLEKEGDPDLDMSDVFKFRVYKSEFESQAVEVKENIRYIRRVWTYVLDSDDDSYYIPDDNFLDPVAAPIQPIDYYMEMAMNSRPELKRIEAGKEAAQLGLEATKARNLPMLFLGLTASYANTPNRPRQSNPFIINNTNYASAGFGIGIRQNLNFLDVKADIRRQEIQLKQVSTLEDAAVDGITLELNDAYKNVKVAHARRKNTEEALTTSKKWLRQEQLDYDMGFGEVKDLLDALRTKLQLEVKLKEQIYKYNMQMGKLYTKSGLQVTAVIEDNSNIPDN